MTNQSVSTVAMKRIIPALLLCAGTLASNTAHAGWLARFLCSGDNDPGLCMSHFSIAVQNASLPPYSERAAQILIEGSKLQGEQKKAFIEKNSQILLGVAPAKQK